MKCKYKKIVSEELKSDRRKELNMINQALVKVLMKWRPGILCFCCAGLLACSEPLCLRQKIDVSWSGETASFTFEIKKEWGYQFALLFSKGDSFEEMQRRFGFFGHLEGGVVVPVNLTVLKDGEVFFDEQINTIGTSWGQTIFFEDRRISVAGRNVIILELPVGHYSAVITIRKGVAEFKDIESFSEIALFNPKV